MEDKHLELRLKRLWFLHDLVGSTRWPVTRGTATNLFGHGRMAVNTFNMQVKPKLLCSSGPRKGTNTHITRIATSQEHRVPPNTCFFFQVNHQKLFQQFLPELPQKLCFRLITRYINTALVPPQHTAALAAGTAIIAI